MNADGWPTYRPGDRVRIHGGTTEYDVLAVGNDSRDIYIREVGSRMAGGTWVDIRSVTLVGEAAG